MTSRHSFSPFVFLAGAVALGLAALASPIQASTSEPTRHTIAGPHVAIYNMVGSLEMVRGEGNSVVAEITLHGNDADRLEIAKGPIRGRETLRVLYNDDRILVREFGEHSNSTLRVNEDGTFRDEKHGGRKVILSGRGSGMEAGADIRLLVPPGKKVDVYWVHGTASVTRVDADLTIDAASMPVNATGIAGSFHVDIGSGHVRVDRADADISIDTGSGEVSLTAVRGKSVQVDTGSGEVMATDVTAPVVSIDTGSGDVHVAKLMADHVSLDTGSGEVAVEVSSGLETLEIDSGSGDVSVIIPKSLGAELTVETGSGGIETNLTMETRVRKHDELVGRIGDGSGRIAIETGSGTVSIRQAAR